MIVFVAYESNGLNGACVHGVASTREKAQAMLDEGLAGKPGYMTPYRDSWGVVECELDGDVIDHDE